MVVRGERRGGGRRDERRGAGGGMGGGGGGERGGGGGGGVRGRVPSPLGGAGGDIGAVDLVETTRERTLRDITVKARDSAHAQRIVSRLRHVAGVRGGQVSGRTLPP